MYISRVRVKNWRNFTQAEAILGETIYLMGPNASGKSNFLDLFRFMRDIVNPKGGGLQQALASRGGMSKVRSLAARRVTEIEIEIEFRESLEDQADHPDWSYLLAIKNETSGHRRPVVAREQVFHIGKLVLDRPDDEDGEDSERLVQTHLEQINANKEFREIASFFEQVLYLHLVPQLLKFSDQLSLRHLESDPFGQGFLEEISSTTESTRRFRLKQIEQILLKVIPNFEQIRFIKDKSTGRPHLEMLYKHWRPNAGWQREDQFSDGTLRMIALIWMLLTSNNMILLEEPELSLHTEIVKQIPNLIYSTRKARKKSGGQILISTHSEAMLGNKSIGGSFLILKPSTHGEATTLESPTEDEIMAMQSGMSPADILLPRTAETIGVM